MRAAFARCVRHRATQVKTRASTRFVKWSRCFLHSGVIGMPCMSIRDGTFSIAPSLTWRAQWRNVRRQRRRRQRLRRRRSALRSGSRRETFSIHVTSRRRRHARSQSCRTSPALVTTEGVGETISSLSDALGLSGTWFGLLVLSRPALSLPGFVCLKRCRALSLTLPSGACCRRSRISARSCSSRRSRRCAPRAIPHHIASDDP